jgi:hypothetical protein
MLADAIEHLRDKDSKFLILGAEKFRMVSVTNLLMHLNSHLNPDNIEGFSNYSFGQLKAVAGK